MAESPVNHPTITRESPVFGAVKERKWLMVNGKWLIYKSKEDEGTKNSRDFHKQREHQLFTLTYLTIVQKHVALVCILCCWLSKVSLSKVNKPR